MIVREWKCLCPGKKRAGFLAHLRATGVAEAESLPGCLGHMVLERGKRGQAEITLLTFWESLEAVRAFAGSDTGRARLYPGDEEFGILPGLEVRHYEVAGARLPETVGA